MNKKNKMLHRDAVSRAVGFEKMARNMARMLPLQNWMGKPLKT